MIAAHDEALEGVNSQDPGVPFVVVEGDLSKARWAVGVDQVAGARLATRHLIELGHTEILHVTGPMNWQGAAGRQCRRGRRHSRGGVPDSPAHHDQAGLPRRGPPRHRGPASGNHPTHRGPATPHRPRSRLAIQHRPTTENPHAADRAGRTVSACSGLPGQPESATRRRNSAKENTCH